MKSTIKNISVYLFFITIGVLIMLAANHTDKTDLILMGNKSSAIEHEQNYGSSLNLTNWQGETIKIITGNNLDLSCSDIRYIVDYLNKNFSKSGYQKVDEVTIEIIRDCDYIYKLTFVVSSTSDLINWRKNNSREWLYNHKKLSFGLYRK